MFGSQWNVHRTLRHHIFIDNTYCSIHMIEGIGEGQTTKILIEEIMNINRNNLDSKTVDKAKLAILDSIGCAIYGSNTPWSKIIVDYVRDLSSKATSTVFLSDIKTDPSNAAFANGTMIHGYEMDDIFMEGKIQPGGVVIPAALSVSEMIDADGITLIEAIVWGYEAMGRIGLGLGPKAAKSRGWHITGITGTFGAAAAAGRLLELSKDEMASAFGLAGTQSAGLFAFTSDGSMSKRIHPGLASQKGVMSAILAKKGFRGPTKILEATDGGFLKTFSDGYDLGKIHKKKEDKLIIERSGFKLYSCCGSINPALDAIKKLVSDERHSEDRVDSIDIGVSKLVLEQCGWNYEPFSVLQAQMSLKFCVASMIRDGQVFINQFTDTKISDPKTVELSKKVNVYVDREADAMYPKKNPARVTLKMIDGSQSTIYVDEPIGVSETNVASPDDLVSKFNSLSVPVIGSLKARKIINEIMNLEKNSNLNDFLSYLRGGSRKDKGRSS